MRRYMYLFSSNILDGHNMGREGANMNFIHIDFPSRWSIYRTSIHLLSLLALFRKKEINCDHGICVEQVI